MKITMTQNMTKQEPRHPTASLCSVADDISAEESYWVKTTRRGAPTKKNTRAVDKESTSRPHHKTIEELLNEIGKRLDQEVEEFRRLAAVHTLNTEEQEGRWDILDIDDSIQGDLDSVSTDGDLSDFDSVSTDGDLNDFDSELDESDLELDELSEGDLNLDWLSEGEPDVLSKRVERVRPSYVLNEQLWAEVQERAQFRAQIQREQELKKRGPPRSMKGSRGTSTSTNKPRGRSTHLVESLAPITYGNSLEPRNHPGVKNCPKKVPARRKKYEQGIFRQTPPENSCGVTWMA
jgi:hypothetical protein